MKTIRGRQHFRLTTTTNELLYCIEPNFQQEAHSHFDAKVFDGAAIMHALPLDNTATSGEYSGTIVIPWTERQLQGCSVIYIASDTYRPDSLKQTEKTRETHRQMFRDTKLPMYLSGFLQYVTNKEECSSGVRCSET